jgi:hypothetical protein
VIFVFILFFSNLLHFLGYGGGYGAPVGGYGAAGGIPDPYAQPSYGAGGFGGGFGGMPPNPGFGGGGYY